MYLIGFLDLISSSFLVVFLNSHRYLFDLLDLLLFFASLFQLSQIYLTTIFMLRVLKIHFVCYYITVEICSCVPDLCGKVCSDELFYLTT
jgi:hypothetical protein